MTVKGFCAVFRVESIPSYASTICTSNVELGLVEGGLTMLLRVSLKVCNGLIPGTPVLTLITTRTALSIKELKFAH